MATFTFVESFTEALCEKKHNLGSDTLKILLTDVAPDAAADAVKADLTEIGAGSGYSAGGTAMTITSSAQTGGTYKLVGNPVSFTAAGGSIGPFRYAMLYNDTAASDELIGWWDYGGEQTITDGNVFTVTPDAVNGILQLAVA